MSDLNEQQIKDALASFIDPYLETDLVSAKTIKHLSVDGNNAELHVELGFPSAGYNEKLATDLKKHLLSLDNLQQIDINVSSKITAHAVQQGTKRLTSVKNIIAIASGKGGVGKSTTAVNLALALQAEGAQAAVLDADIYGPSLPAMLGCKGHPESLDGKLMEPKVSYGVQSISIGHLVDEETPMIWRGPMAVSALQQLLNDTNWNDVDYLIVDLPPGTGDIQLTLSQQIPVSCAVIVTTPQDIALLDARKALNMFEKVNIPVTGIVENMSTHVCSECGHEEAIFGSGGGERMAKQYGIDLLGQLPLDMKIRESADAGQPSVASEPDSAISQTYREIARKISAKLALQSKDYSAKFPKIVVENN